MGDDPSYENVVTWMYFGVELADYICKVNWKPISVIGKNKPEL